MKRSKAREEAEDKLYDFIVNKIGLNVKFTYNDLPSIKDLSEEFYGEYAGQYGAIERSHRTVMSSSMNEMALGELLQALIERAGYIIGQAHPKVVGYKTFILEPPGT